MASARTRVLLAAATFLSGILAGGAADRVDHTISIANIGLGLEHRFDSDQPLQWGATRRNVI
jgi:hypothetical protein